MVMHDLKERLRSALDEIQWSTVFAILIPLMAVLLFFHLNVKDEIRSLEKKMEGRNKADERVDRVGDRLDRLDERLFDMQKRLSVSEAMAVKAPPKKRVKASDKTTSEKNEN